jgi:phospholipase/carboxylesterase
VTTTTAGTRGIGLDTGRDGIIHVPRSAVGVAAPVLVLLHGAGGSGGSMFKRVADHADEAGVVVLSPDSRGPTWDAIRGDFGPDVIFVNRALERLFATVGVDPARLAIGGFSDGATYALSLGLPNGDLFPRIVAFSPGFVVEGPPTGLPGVFVSHGTTDAILPIDRCSRRIVPELERRGHHVTYREFTGGHAVPAEVAREGFRFLAAR